MYSATKYECTDRFDSWNEFPDKQCFQAVPLARGTVTVLMELALMLLGVSQYRSPEGGIHAP